VVLNYYIVELKYRILYVLYSLLFIISIVNFYIWELVDLLSIDEILFGCGNIFVSSTPAEFYYVFFIIISKVCLIIFLWLIFINIFFMCIPIMNGLQFTCSFLFFIVMFICYYKQYVYLIKIYIYIYYNEALQYYNSISSVVLYYNFAEYIKEVLSIHFIINILFLFIFIYIYFSIDLLYGELKIISVIDFAIMCLYLFIIFLNTDFGIFLLFVYIGYKVITLVFIILFENYKNKIIRLVEW
jgi:hypothetical protein